MLRLVIGNKNYSSWSLRAWLALRKSGLPFEEERLVFDTDDFRERVGALSPSRKVPALHDGDRVIWESLAIAEYVAERAPEARLWPDDAAARAHGRAIACEMHAGFPALRADMPMNCRARGRRVAVSDALLRDLDRLMAVWGEARRRHGGEGPWLLGTWSIADAMYIPVATRLVTYGVEVEGEVAAYLRTVYEDPDFRDWLHDAAAESEVVPHEEVGETPG